MKGLLKKLTAAIVTTAVMFGGMGEAKADLYPRDGQQCSDYEELFPYVPARYEYDLCTMAPISEVINQAEYTHPEYHSQMMEAIELGAEQSQCYAARDKFREAGELAGAHELYVEEAVRGATAASACIDMKVNGSLDGYELFRSPYGAWVSITGERSSMD